MQKIWAKHALLPDGWANDVMLEIGEDGKIGSVGFSGADATAVRVGILLPAPTNCHSHSFQRAMAGLSERRGPKAGDTFWTWRQLMFRFLERLTPAHIETIASLVQMEMLEAGYACIVEFHYLHNQPSGQPYDTQSEMAGRIISAADQTGIGLTLLPVHYQFGGCDKRPLTAGQRRFGTDMNGFEGLWQASKALLQSLPEDSDIGVAPHSLRAVAPESLAQLQHLAQEKPLHMHIAEQRAEIDEFSAKYGARPVEWLLDNVDITTNWCLIHATQMHPHETLGLAKTGAVAGLCPITESNLGDGIFDAVRWLNANGKIAIGSDSNIQIALAAELKTLEYTQRLRDHSRAALATDKKSTGRRIFDAICAGGAQAAGRRSGAIEAGNWADLLVLDDQNIDLAIRRADSVLDTYIFAGDDRMVKQVWSAGRHMVKDGKHIGRRGILRRYLRMLKEFEELV